MFKIVSMYLGQCLRIEFEATLEDALIMSALMTDEYGTLFVEVGILPQMAI